MATAKPKSTATKSTATTRTAPKRAAAAATRRSTAAKKGVATKARTSTAAEIATPVSRVQQFAERAVLVQVGAALEARDRVVDAVTTLADTSASRAAATKTLKKFERRGKTARTKIERELRQRRTRVERVVKRNRSRVETELRKARRDVEKQGKQLVETVSANVDQFTAQVEDVVQTGVTSGTKAVNEVVENVAS